MVRNMLRRGVTRPGVAVVESADWTGQGAGAVVSPPRRAPWKGHPSSTHLIQKPGDDMTTEAAEVRASSLQRWLLRLSPRRQRLVGSARAARAEMRGSQRNQAVALTLDAERAAHDGRLAFGWKALHAAGRQELLGLSRPELLAHATALRVEAAQKLRGWRGDAAVALLDHALGEEPGQRARAAIERLRDDVARESGDDCERTRVLDRLNVAIKDADSRAAPPSDAECATFVWAATWIRDEAANNEYAGISHLQFQIWCLLVWIACLLVAAAALLGNARFLDDAKFPLSGTADATRFVGTVLVLGALSGALSGILSLARGAPKSLPKQISDAKVTLCRPLIGAALALGAVVLLRGGVLNFVQLTPASALAAAFICGFTERIVVGRIEALANADKPSPST